MNGWLSLGFNPIHIHEINMGHHPRTWGVGGNSPEIHGAWYVFGLCRWPRWYVRLDIEHKISQGGHQFIWLVYDIASLRIPYVVRQSHEWLVNHHWLVVWNMIFIFPYIGNRNPNWQSHTFQRGRSTTNQIRASVYPMLGIGPAKNRSLAASTDNNRIKGDPVRSWFLLTHPQ